MKIVVVANNLMKAELLSEGLKEGVEVVWINNPASFFNYPDADGFIDLLFEPERSEILKKLQPKPVLINCVNCTLQELSPGFTRINAWPGFLNRALMEAAAAADEEKQKAEKVISCFNKKPRWVPDTAGFITARVISTIINEAYFALNEAISTKEEIDTAMKLGTNYPYGPFEWSQKIGLKNICDLLNKLSEANPRYKPSGLLMKELNN